MARAEEGNVIELVLSEHLLDDTHDSVESHEHDGSDGAAKVAHEDHADADGIEHEVDWAKHIGLDDIAVGATSGELDIIALPTLTPRLYLGAG